MFTAIITKNGKQVAAIDSKTAHGAELRALDWIDDRDDEGEEDAHEVYDYDVIAKGEN